MNDNEALNHVINDEAVLRQVGWYCAGEEIVCRMHGGEPLTNVEDFCPRTVPVYVLVKPEVPELPAFNGYTGHKPWVHTLVGKHVMVTIEDEDQPLVGILASVHDDEGIVVSLSNVTIHEQQERQVRWRSIMSVELLGTPPTSLAGVFV